MKIQSVSTRVAATTCVLANCFCCSLLAATPTAFVGTWAWNPETKGATLTVKNTSGRTYALTNTHGGTDHVVADGLFHKSDSSDDEQISLQKTGDDEWTLKSKHDNPNPARSTFVFIISKDGKTMTERSERISTNGDLNKFEALLTRSKPGTGIEGEWTFEKYILQEGPRVTMTITSAAPDQLTLTNNYSKEVLTMASLDGKLYKESGPEASAKQAFSTKLIDDHTLIFETYKDGSLVETGKWTVSSDGKTMSMVETPKGKPQYSVSYTKQ